MNLPGPASAAEILKTLPDWVPRDLLIELLLIRQTSALMLFEDDTCVYASSAARSELGLSETGGVPLTLATIFDGGSNASLSANDTDDPGPLSSNALIRTDGRRINVACWLDDLSIAGRNARALMFRHVETPDAGIVDELARLTIMDSAPDPIFVKDLDGRYTLVNRNMAAFFGMTEEEIIGRRAADLCPPELAEQIKDHDAEVLEKKTTVTRESVETWPHGSYTFLVSKFPVLDASGEVVGIGGLQQDITEAANTRRALEDSEKRLRAFLENIDAEVNIKDLQGRY
ncbi:MAG TPA: PAS domain-containing protein, partial [Gammaproteobacteria bacterium]